MIVVQVGFVALCVMFTSVFVFGLSIALGESERCERTARAAWKAGFVAWGVMVVCFLWFLATAVIFK
jgi:hypothetical protein